MRQAIAVALSLHCNPGATRSRGALANEPAPSLALARAGALWASRLRDGFLLSPRFRRRRNAPPARGHPPFRHPRPELRPDPRAGPRRPRRGSLGAEARYTGAAQRPAHHDEDPDLRRANGDRAAAEE